MNKFLFSFFLSIVSFFSSFAQNNNSKPLYSTQFIKDEISLRLNNMVDFEFDEYGRAWILLTNSLVLYDGNKYESIPYSQLGIPDYSFKKIYKNSSGGLYLVGFRNFSFQQGLKINLNIIILNPLLRTWAPIKSELLNNDNLINFYGFENHTALINKKGFFYIKNKDKWIQKFKIPNAAITTIFPANKGEWHAYSEDTYFNLSENGNIIDSARIKASKIKDFIEFKGQNEKCFLQLENDCIRLLDKDYQFKNKLSFPNKTINLNKANHLFIDKNLRIWMKYQNSVSVYNERGEIFQDFPEIKNQNIFWRGQFPIKEDVLGKVWIHLGFGFFYNSLINKDIKFYFKNEGYSFRGLQQINDSIIYFNSYKGNGLLNLNTGLNTYLSSKNNYFLGAFLNEKKHRIYIGTNNSKYEIFNLDNFQVYEKTDIDKLFYHFVYLEKGLNNKYFWLGDFGFQSFDMDNDTLGTFFPLPPGHSSISSFLDMGSFYLVGTDRGLLKYSLKNKGWMNLAVIPKVRVTGIKYFKNRFLISTAANGLFVLNNKFEMLGDIRNKLEPINKVIFSMLIGSDDMIWLGTEKGLYKVNPLNGKYYMYAISDGIFEEEFNWLSMLNLKNGEILMGTINGLVRFNPRNMSDSFTDFGKGKFYFSSIEINNNSNTRNRNGLLDYLNKGKITLNPNEYSLTLYPGFSNNYIGKSLLFFVKTPYLDDWQLIKNFNSITLSPTAGKSNIQIRISQDSPDNFIKEINIPIYKLQRILENKTFLGLVLFLFLSLIGIIFFLRNRLLTGKNRALEKDLAIRVNDLELNEQNLIDKNNKLAILNEERRRFFDILGHEVNTPLAGMKQLSHTFNYLLKKGEYEKALKIAQSLEHSGNEISHLVDNLLTWSNLEKKTQFSKNITFNILDSFKATSNLFMFQMDRKSIKYSLSVNDEFDGEIESDPNIIGFIFRNILSNAIKYCPENGEINCSIHKYNDSLILSVFNTSDVISKDDFLLDIGVAPKISIPGTLQEKGLGIGLFMIFQLINKIKGEIEFKIHEEGGFTALITL
jgi:signal transduction histidine kinase